MRWRLQWLSSPTRTSDPEAKHKGEDGRVARYRNTKQHSMAEQCIAKRSKAIEATKQSKSKESIAWQQSKEKHGSKALQHVAQECKAKH